MNARHQFLKLAKTVAVVSCCTSVVAASFDCTKASSEVERAICASASISSLDSQLGVVYATALASSSEAAALRAEQRRWLRQVRDKCPDQDCIATAYRQRTRELNALSNTSAAAARTMQPGYAPGPTSARSVDATESMARTRTLSSLPQTEAARSHATNRMGPPGDPVQALERAFFSISGQCRMIWGSQVASALQQIRTVRRNGAIAAGGRSDYHRDPNSTTERVARDLALKYLGAMRSTKCATPPGFRLPRVDG